MKATLNADGSITVEGRVDDVVAFYHLLEADKKPKERPIVSVPPAPPTPVFPPPRKEPPTPAAPPLAHRRKPVTVYGPPTSEPSVGQTVIAHPLPGFDSGGALKPLSGSMSEHAEGPRPHGMPSPHGLPHHTQIWSALRDTEGHAHVSEQLFEDYMHRQKSPDDPAWQSFLVTLGRVRERLLREAGAGYEWRQTVVNKKEGKCSEYRLVKVNP